MEAQVHMHTVFIGLGSNLSCPTQQIHNALHSIGELASTRVVKTSSLYGSRPLGPQDQPDFVNAVCEIETAFKPQQLLKSLQTIEKEQGRIKKRHWGERVIDLDILLFNDLQMKTPELTIPHSQMHLRDFVLMPLAEIAPDVEIPSLGAIQSLLDELSESYLITL